MRYIFFVLMFVTISRAQLSLFDFEKELRESTSASEFRKKVEQFISGNPNTVEAIFFKGLIEPDAEKSIDAYNKVLEQFPKSEYAEKSLFKLGQYYYSRGLYVSARTNFLKLLNDFPDSGYAEQSAYFAASCLCASRQIEQCSVELKQFMMEYKDSELRNLAQLDYEELKPVAQVPQTEIAEPELKFNENAKYTLQMGVFTKPNNALNYRNFFTRLNLPAVVRERKMKNKPIYFVLLGSFQDKESAEESGKKLQERHGKPYRIVEIK